MTTHRNSFSQKKERAWSGDHSAMLAVAKEVRAVVQQMAQPIADRLAELQTQLAEAEGRHQELEDRIRAAGQEPNASLTEIHEMRRQRDRIHRNELRPLSDKIAALNRQLKGSDVTAEAQYKDGSLSHEPSGDIEDVLADTDGFTVDTLRISARLFQQDLSQLIKITVSFNRDVDVVVISSAEVDISVSGVDGDWVESAITRIHRVVRRQVPAWAWLRTSVGFAVMFLVGWAAALAPFAVAAPSLAWVGASVLSGPMFAATTWFRSRILLGFDLRSDGQASQVGRRAAIVAGAAELIIGVVSLPLGALLN